MIKLTQTVCPLCNSAESKLIFATRDRLNSEDVNLYQVVKCIDCGLHFVNPRPLVDYIPDLYTKKYYCPDSDPMTILAQKLVSNEHKYASFSHHFNGKGRILDVGCQKGEFLAFMRDRGWDVQGVEFSEDAPNLYHLPIHYGSLASAGLTPGYFDVITYWAVLEHIPEVSKEIETAVKLLKPGGLLVLLTTNYNSIATGLLKLDDIPRHLVLFDKRSLRKLVEIHGMSIDKIFTSDRIFKASANCLLRYSNARWIARDLDVFYRELFRVLYEPQREMGQRLARLRSLGFFQACLIIADRALGFLIDRFLLLLDMYGIVTIIARKK